MFRWLNINKCMSKIIHPYVLRPNNCIHTKWLFKFTTLKNENKIFPKKNLNNNILMQNIKVADDGNAICEQLLFSKYDLPYVLKIPVSDLRLIDTGNNNHNPTILIRKDVILLRTGFISCIIRYNEIWLFDGTNSVVINAKDLISRNLKKNNNNTSKNCNNRIVESLCNKSGTDNGQKNVKQTDGCEKEDVKQINSYEKEELNYLNVINNFYRYNKGKAYFEFLCLDICMQLSIKEYENDLEGINYKIRDIILLQRKEENNELNMLTNKLLRDMMKIKNNLQKLSNLLNALRTNIEKILNNEHDMKNMYLTYLNKNKCNNLKDCSDLEILLETHLQLTDELYGQLENVEEKITHYEELMRLNLDYNRNKFILLNAKISFSTLLFSISSVVTSLFGMNLKNFVEDSNYAFISVSIFVSVWSIIGIYVTKNINTLLKFFDRYNFR
ncbi:CorA-like Mg2+ transporter protein, putative [Plasmodium yoelii]|nr:CorA-like Mg2+ transporter protein, putative [Plasmodium yoelii]CDU18071.1 metal ion channel, putative [Plasmodium yoelii]VTZ78488.1 CorA-like Mg2+ transporter protein, putative [Plasmodium yoelii]|eukprot:XP_727592.2 CorA-like Mg2+ transporter protein, putative [Plasmodium yoelii]